MRKCGVTFSFAGRVQAYLSLPPLGQPRLEVGASIVATYENQREANLEFKAPPRVCTQAIKRAMDLCFGTFMDPVGLVASHLGPHFTWMPPKCPRSAADAGRNVVGTPRHSLCRLHSCPFSVALHGGHPSKPESYLGCGAYERLLQR